MLSFLGIDSLGVILGGVAGVVAVAWAALFRAKRQGAADANAKRDADDMENAYERERMRNEIDRSIDGAGAHDSLRADWRRD